MKMVLFPPETWTSVWLWQKLLHRMQGTSVPDILQTVPSVYLPSQIISYDYKKTLSNTDVIVEMYFLKFVCKLNLGITKAAARIQTLNYTVFTTL